MKRIMLSMSDELFARLERYSEQTGVPKASACTVWVAQGLGAVEASQRAIERSVTPELLEKVTLALAENLPRNTAENVR